MFVNSSYDPSFSLSNFLELSAILILLPSYSLELLASCSLFETAAAL